MSYNLGNVAVVADQMTALGGADREMFSLLKLIPQADIYTVLYNPKAYSNDIQQKIYTSFIQKIPFKYALARHLKVFKPIAYESLDLRQYDTIITMSAGPARGIIPSFNQQHIAMVLTPPRSLWDKELNVRGKFLKSIYKPISKILNNYLRIWDQSLVPRVDYWVANSRFVARKIKKRYGVESKVIYPGISEEYFEEFKEKEIEAVLEKYNIPSNFLLVVSRLYDYKRVDWAIKSALDTDRNLVIVGEGPDDRYLQKLAKGKDNIYFLGFLKEDREVRILYKQAEALLFCGIEDFGLVPVEAMAQGTPILAYNQGGATETVVSSKTGEFFDNQKELTHILKNFDKNMYNPEEIVQRAEMFSEERFLQNLDKYFENIYEE